MPRKGRRGFVIDNPRLRLHRQRIRQAPAELAGLSSQAVTTHREDETLLGLDDDGDQPISCDDDDHIIAGGDSVSSVQADFGSSDASDDQDTIDLNDANDEDIESAIRHGILPSVIIDELSSARNYDELINNGDVVQVTAFDEQEADDEPPPSAPVAQTAILASKHAISEDISVLVPHRQQQFNNQKTPHYHHSPSLF